MRTVTRYGSASGMGKIVRMKELRKGDVFTIQDEDGNYIGDSPHLTECDECKWVATSDPGTDVDDGVWGIVAEPLRPVNPLLKEV